MDTPQQKSVLRTNRTARKVRKHYGAGTRVVVTRGAGMDPEPGAMHGTVKRHVPGTNAQGGHLVVTWDSGVTGNVSAGNLRREDGRAWPTG